MKKSNEKRTAAAGAYELYFSMQHSAHDEEKLINIQFANTTTNDLLTIL